MEGVRVFGCLVAEGVRLDLVLERDSEYATLARVEDMHMAAHIVRREPRGALIIFETRVLDLLAARRRPGHVW